MNKLLIIRLEINDFHDSFNEVLLEIIKISDFPIYL